MTKGKVKSQFSTKQSLHGVLKSREYVDDAVVCLCVSVVDQDRVTTLWPDWEFTEAESANTKLSNRSSPLEQFLKGCINFFYRFY